MKKHLSVLLALVLCAMMLLCACGDSARENRKEADFPNAEDGIRESKATSDVVITNDRKIIYTVNMSVTVKDLKDVSRQLSERVNVSGGWTESSREERGYMYLTYRVPVAEMNTFIDLLSGCGEVNEKSINTKDITDQYADTERAKDLYVKEYEAYAALYETLSTEPASPENTDNKLRILKAMQEAASMIDAYNGELSSYDQLVDYATFSIYLYEENVYEEPSYWSELGDVFSGSVNSVGSVFGFLLKAAVAILPYAAILGCVFGGVLLIIKLSANSQKKKEKKKDDGE